MELKDKLTGENLAFYQNIEDLKKLTVKAKALIARSHTVFNDIIRKDLLKVRATVAEAEEDDHSLKSLQGECRKCGLHHGAHDFCILQEIMTVEKDRRDSPKKSSVASIYYQEDAGEASQDVSTITLPTATPQRKVPSRRKVEKWENLLYGKMTPKELEDEYLKICYRYGIVTGRKFLYARSLAREPDPVPRLFTSESRKKREKERSKGKTAITSLMKECVFQKNLYHPRLCSDFSPEVSQKIATVLDVDLPCDIKTPKYNKPWKNVFNMKHQPANIAPEMLEDEYSASLFSSESMSSEWCTCMLHECECGAYPLCSPPRKKCWTTLVDSQQNYLLTIRERLRQHRLLAGEIPKEFHHTVIQSPSKRISHNFLRRDSEMMMIKSKELYKQDLKNCIKSSIGVDLDHLDQEKFDKNVQKITEITSVFTKPDERAWDKWIERFQAQDELCEERSISGESSFPTSSSSKTSITDQELGDHRPTKQIPFVKEPFKLVDILYSKIFARFQKSVLKSSMKEKFNTYKKELFFNHIDSFMPYDISEIIRRKLFNKLNLQSIYLKRLKPDHVIKAERLKRLQAKSKQLSKITKRRKYVESIQLGKRFRRPRKSMNFTKDNEFIAFNARDRNLLQKPLLERLAGCNLLGDVNGVLLSKKRIHYQYRLLRTLFDGPMESGDRENLMDVGMRERFLNFKKTLNNSSCIEVVDESDSEDDGVELLKVASVPVRSPVKRDEKTFKSAPGCFPSQARNNSRKLSSPSKYDTDERTNPRKNKSPSLKSSMDTTRPDCDERPDVRSSNETLSNARKRWSRDIAPTLLQVLNAKSGKNSSHILSSEDVTHQTQSNRIGTLPRTFENKRSKVFASQDSSHSYVQWAPYRLPTPPLSETSCDELEFESIQHRVPPKEEARIQTSARVEIKSRETQIKQNISNHCYSDKQESELTDRSSDSYVPQLLSIPPKRTSARPGSSISFNLDEQRQARHKPKSRTRAKATYVSDSSSTENEKVHPSRRKERPAWDHKSRLNRHVAPYLNTQTHTRQRYHAFSGPPAANFETVRTHYEKNTFPSPLPKAGRSILRNSSSSLRLPNPPSYGTREKASKTLVTDPVKCVPLSDSICRTTSSPKEGLMKPPRLITEQLLKAQQGSFEDIPASSSKKYSSLSRATPDAATISPPTPSISTVPTKKTTVSPALNVSTAGQLQTEDGDDTLQHHVSIKILPNKKDSPGHPAADSFRKMSSTHTLEPELQKTESSKTTSSKRLSKRASKLVSEVFRQRSLAPSEHSAERRELQNKFGTHKKGPLDDTSLQNLSNSSVKAKLKKLEAIGPTNKRSFNLDIGQGINCVNYLKANAPGADEAKKKELVDLLCTQVEVKKVAKKVEKEVSMECSIVKSLQSATHVSTSSSIFSPTHSSKVVKPQARVVRDDATPLTKKTFKSLDQIYKEVHGINEHNTPRKLVENDYEFEAKKKQQLTKHKIFA